MEMLLIIIIYIYIYSCTYIAAGGPSDKKYSLCQIGRPRLLGRYELILQIFVV